MAYQLRLEETTVKAGQYFSPGEFTRRSSNGMKRWMARQLQFDKEAIEIKELTFIQWIKLLKYKSLTVDKL